MSELTRRGFFGFVTALCFWRPKVQAKPHSFDFTLLPPLPPIRDDLFTQPSLLSQMKPKGSPVIAMAKAGELKATD